MNRIVKEHYPASKLRKDLRDGLDPSSMVTVTIEEVYTAPTREELVTMLEDARKRAKPGTIQDAVARVRALRDEWDD